MGKKTTSRRIHTFIIEEPNVCTHVKCCNVYMCDCVLINETCLFETSIQWPGLIHPGGCASVSKVKITLKMNKLKHTLSIHNHYRLIFELMCTRYRESKCTTTLFSSLSR